MIFEMGRKPSPVPYTKFFNGLMSCSTINNYLRKNEVCDGTSEVEIKAFIEEMNSSISDFVLGKALTSYRGMWFKPGDPFLSRLDDDLHRMVNTNAPAIYLEKGFMSTTRGIETMKSYAKESRKDVCHVYISITAEKGVPAMPLSFTYGTTVNKNDKEILFQSGRTYYIIAMNRIWRGGNLYDYHISLLATDRRIRTC